MTNADGIEEGDRYRFPEVEREREDDTLRARVGHEADDEDDRFVKVTRRPENPGQAFIGYYTLKIPVEELPDYVAVLTELLELVEDAEEEQLVSTDGGRTGRYQGAGRSREARR